MGIWARLKALFKSNINDMISKAEDPEKMLNQVLEEMRDQFAEAKKAVALAIADEKRLKKQWDEETGRAQSWEKKAIMAVRAKDDQLAKQALLQKAESTQLAQQYQQQWEAQKQAAEQLKGALKTLSRKIEEARRKKNLLIAKKKRAEAQQSIQQTMGKLTDSSAFNTYARMEEKIERMEAEAEASMELTAAMNETAQLEDKFQEMELQQTAEAMLAELKDKISVEEAAKQRAALPEGQTTEGEKELDLDAELEKMKEKLREEVKEPA